MENLSPALGVSHTVRLGLKKAAELGAEGAVFLVCDQPLLRPATLARLMESHRPGRISCVRSGGVPGNPVLFDRAFFRNCWPSRATGAARRSWGATRTGSCGSKPRRRKSFGISTGQKICGSWKVLRRKKAPGENG